MPFPPDPMLRPVATGAAPRAPLRGLMLLIVDDSRFASDALRLILQRAGARFRRADSLEVARLHLGCYRPDLTIVDLGLPDGRGEDLIAELAAKGQPVLGLSGDPEGRARALAAGAAEFLEKPVPSAAALVTLIRHLVTGAGAEMRGDDHHAPIGDPVALRDDLVVAADLVKTRGNPAYALAFLQSLAHAAADRPLEEAARQATTPFDRARLARMIEERLAALKVVT
jgi:DNA-binding response OmpR family regulator